MYFNNNIHLYNLKNILEKSFEGCKVAVVNNLNIKDFLLGENLDINKHLENDERVGWFREKLVSDDYSIFCFFLFRAAPHNSQQRQIPDPLSEARDRTCILMDTSRVCYC